MSFLRDRSGRQSYCTLGDMAQRRPRLRGDGMHIDASCDINTWYYAALRPIALTLGLVQQPRKPIMHALFSCG